MRNWPIELFTVLALIAIIYLVIFYIISDNRQDKSIGLAMLVISIFTLIFIHIFRG